MNSIKKKIDDRQLEEHLRHGGSILSFAKSCGRSAWYVNERAKLLGISKKQWQRDEELSAVDRAWIAACIDCEGTITVHVPWNKPRKCRNIQCYIRVNMVNKSIPLRLYDLCGGSLKQKIRRAKDGNRRSQWYWNITANGCRWLIPQILTYLIEKRKHAEILDEILRGNGTHARMDRMRLCDLINELRGLNTKGFRASPVQLNPSELVGSQK